MALRGPGDKAAPRPGGRRSPGSSRRGRFRAACNLAPPRALVTHCDQSPDGRCPGRARARRVPPACPSGPAGVRQPTPTRLGALEPAGPARPGRVSDGLAAGRAVDAWSSGVRIRAPAGWLADVGGGPAGGSSGWSAGRRPGPHAAPQRLPQPQFALAHRLSRPYAPPGTAPAIRIVLDSQARA